MKLLDIYKTKLNENKVEMDFTPEKLSTEIKLTFKPLTTKKISSLLNMIHKNNTLPTIKNYIIQKKFLKLQLTRKPTLSDVNDFIEEVEEKLNISLTLDIDKNIIDKKFISKEIANPLYIIVDEGIVNNDVEKIKNIIKNSTKMDIKDIDIVGNLIAIHWNIEPDDNILDELMIKIKETTNYLTRWRI